MSNRSHIDCTSNAPKPLRSTFDLAMLSLFTWGLLAAIWLGGCLDDLEGVHCLCHALIIDPTGRVVNAKFTPQASHFFGVG